MKKIVYILPIIVTLLISSCSSEEPERARVSGVELDHHVQIRHLGDTEAIALGLPEYRPAPDADSLFYFVERQLAFGPRNPNSEGHRNAGDWFMQELGKRAGSGFVFAQEFETEGYDETLKLRNIIASFNPQARRRILLAAHWDTRPRADHHTNEEMQHKPLLGADDGASGVAVLLEMARLMHENPPPIGVDLMLFDGEDYGREGDLGKYFLGSRYWSQNPPVPGYNPRFGVLVDMVGGENAIFPRELYSETYAPKVNDAVWNIASQLGYERFSQDQGFYVQDDHLMLNEIARIPTINIIHQTDLNRDGTRRSQPGFPWWWHTLYDDIEIIDPQVLLEVADVLTELIYRTEIR